MSLVSNSHSRKQERIPSRSSSNTVNDQQSSVGPSINIAQSLVVPESTTYAQHYGQTFNTTNTGNGPVNNVGHIENASFHLVDGGSLSLLWNSLPKQRDTSGQHNEYLEGSREEDITAILHWVDSSLPGEMVLWIRGAAGVGKSTLARQLTHVLRAHNRLAASVLLSAVPTDARGPESVVKIIARELATLHPAAIPHVLSAISSCHNAPLREHIEMYLCGPSRSLRLPGSAVFLLDAIDEWEHYGMLVKELESITDPYSTIKFILLGRSDPRTGMNLLLSSGTSAERPPKARSQEVVELADGLFIWAKVVCSLFKKKLSRSSPSETLEAIVYSHRSIGAEEGLSRLYHQAIVWLFPDSEDRELLQQYLGFTLVLQEPLPMDAFSSLAKLSPHATEGVNSQLAALQIRHPVGDTVPRIHPANMLLHLSFLEYIESLSLPSDIAFHTSAVNYHSQLAESCLVQLRQFLPNAHRLKPAKLSAQQKYAVKYMPLHVYRGTPSVEPESDAEWKRTQHFSLLQEMGVTLLLQWKHLLLALVHPGHSVEATDVVGKSTGDLMTDVAARLEEGPEGSLSVRIACLEVAVRLAPGNPHSWSGLGWAYRSLAVSTRSRDACDRAVRAHRNSLKAEGISNADKGHFLFSLGTILNNRYDYLGSPHDLEEAITVLRSAMATYGPDHPDHADCLNNLALTLSKTDSACSLQESVHLHRKALGLRPPGHPERDSTLNNLGFALSKTGFIGDLEESIHLHYEALELRPPGNSERDTTLNNLATSLSETGSASDLQESIRLHREALELRSPGHPHRGYSLENLARSLSKTGSVRDLRESISLYSEALELRPPGHPRRDITLNNLADSLTKTGSAGDLHRSIHLYREALHLCPLGRPDHALVVKNLANALEMTGFPNDLEESIRLYHNALELCPPGHPTHGTTLYNLANALAKTGSPDDRDESISLYRKALELHPPGHQRRGHLFLCLADQLYKTGLISELQETICRFREELELCLPGHPERNTTLNSLVDRLSETGSTEDLQESIRLYREVLELQPQGHPKRDTTFHNLAHALS
ncbi:hypothetical protein NMY22_g2556 [Coprinellus aureogranulatus]|nr:hypothetical protein NMY22_g2556 [Coprinellus aureogranulatus]